jgi:flagellar basal-body rod modification protein FlgD
MASPVSALNGSSTTAPTQSSALGTSAPTEQMFLQLLVAQLQNQDPMNPTDSTQFVSQLAQFSELEQVMGIKGDIESYHAAAAAAAAAATPTSTSNQTGTPSTSGTGTTNTTNQAQL